MAWKPFVAWSTVPSGGHPFNFESPATPSSEHPLTFVAALPYYIGCPGLVPLYAYKGVCRDQGWVQIHICIWIKKIGIFVCVFELKITKGHIFVFDIWSVFKKYLQIQSNIHKIAILPTKGNALPDINWLRSLNRMFFMPVVWSTVGRQHWENWPTWL